MSETSIQEIMQAYAADAVGYARSQFGIDLDYSEQSLVSVDNLLSMMTAQGLLATEEMSEDRQDYIWTLCKAIGGYVGEVIVRHIGAQWETAASADGSETIKLKVANRLTASPPEKVWKRLTESETDMIIGYYRALQHMLGLKKFLPPELGGLR